MMTLRYDRLASWRLTENPIEVTASIITAVNDHYLQGIIDSIAEPEKNSRIKPRLRAIKSEKKKAERNLLTVICRLCALK
jgi:hypothetical protein